MPKLSHQKLKLLYLMQILLEKTDEEHTLTVPDMIYELAKFNISAERKSIYDDLEHLKLFGLDIECRKTKTHDYYVASRKFAYSELKLLVDSVQSSKFITQKKNMELVKKISCLTSVHRAKKLKRQVFISNRIKTMNELMYYNVDTIHEAITENKQICFRYFEWTVDKKEKFRKDGCCYIENPIALTFDDENYYLITYKEKYNNYTYYRVDKMTNTEILEQCRKLPKENFDIGRYAKQVFSMLGGKETEVYIQFSNNLIGAIFDRFGKDVLITKTNDKYFTIKVNVAVNHYFLSWIISLGENAKIISPNSIIDKVCTLANNTILQYT